ncbi:MAG: hypothetical protein QOJ57_3090, partial [Thermoleophilaceae bacterium]|nr:hypothetical protein [Thermoleophilaceae bacterium]
RVPSYDPIEPSNSSLVSSDRWAAVDDLAAATALLVEPGLKPQDRLT